ncbi:hypothetical protein [Paenibacillus gallinarum]|uniref:Uncharacterized protein n=1 Tax=Paenibacillus gallinarum TaxID=2762232 RepID=A0ABR8T131_9BACL|nr:hypothetical protein [Paenibacillus gallinarum]MBD7969467.1 hypothetical protein [Paenibacillus gallinarum]
MIIAIMIHEDPFYYNVIDEIGTNLEELQQEFGSWMSTIEGNHPFRIYTEFVESDGEISFADYVNVYGPDDFIGWLNVDKYNDKVAVRLKNTGDIVPEATIRF